MMRRQSVDATAGHIVDLESLRQAAADAKAEREAMAEKRRKRRDRARRRRQSVVDAGGDLRKGGKGKGKKSNSGWQNSEDWNNSGSGWGSKGGSSSGGWTKNTRPQKPNSWTDNVANKYRKTTHEEEEE